MGQVIFSRTYEVPLDQDGSVEITHFDELSLYRLRFHDNDYNKQHEVTLTDKDISIFLNLFKTVEQNINQPITTRKKKQKWQK